MLGAQLSFAYYGKVPTYGDFVRLNASGREVVSLDEWLQEGLYLGKQARRDWGGAYEQARPLCFLFHPDGAGRSAVGVLSPSRDRSGRQFPFLLFALVDGLAFSPGALALVPVQFEPFLDDALRESEAVRGGGSVEQLAAAVRSYPLPEGSAAVRARYEHYLRRRGFDPANGYGVSRDVLIRLVELLLPLRGRDVSKLGYGVRLPLAADADTAAYDACFWIDATLRILGRSDVRPFLFWGGGTSEHPPRLYLFLRRPPVRSFADVLLDVPANEHVYDLSQPSGRSPEPAASHIRALLGRDGLTLDQALHAL